MNCEKCEKEIGKKDEWVEVSEWTGNLRETHKVYHRKCVEEENKGKDWKEQAEQFLDNAETYLPTIKSILGFIPDKNKNKKK